MAKLVLRNSYKNIITKFLREIFKLKHLSSYISSVNTEMIPVESEISIDKIRINI